MMSDSGITLSRYVKAVSIYDLLGKGRRFHCFSCHPSSILPLSNYDDSSHYNFMSNRKKISRKIRYQEIQLQ